MLVRYWSARAEQIEDGMCRVYFSISSVYGNGVPD